MRPFAYLRARDPGEAVTEAGAGARFVAGGTNLLDLMKLGVERPVRLIDVGGLPLRDVRMETETLVIGAVARMHDVARHVAVRRHFAAISAALLASASPQLRHMATIGGNLLQRTRCGYFRDLAFPCNKRNPGSGCAAIDGNNRRHAVLGTSAACIAAHASDLAVALVAHDAVLRLLGPAGERRVALREFYRLPGETPHIETDLGADELITAVEVPRSPAGSQAAYVKVRDRAGFDFALASAAAVLRVRGGRIEEARLALGGVATVPWRAAAAEDVLKGAAPERPAFERAAARALAGARAGGGNGYKIDLARRVLVRALDQAAEAG